jgi:F0F1-type ATP synthase assembly protein I
MKKRRRNPLFKYKDNRPWMENLQLVMQLGLTMAGCIIFCFFVGLYLDRWLGLRGPFIVVFTILGIAGGAVVVYRQIMEVFEAKDDDGEDEGKN